MDFNAIKNKVVDSKDVVKKGLNKAGDVAKTRFGHASEIDKGIQAADRYLDTEYAKQHPQAGQQAGASEQTPAGPLTPQDPNTA